MPRILATLARTAAAAGALLAATAALASPVVFHFTGEGYDGVTQVNGTFGWDSNAVAWYLSPNSQTAVYWDTPSTPVGGFITAQITGGVYSGAEFSDVLNSWNVLDSDANAGADSIVSTSSLSWIMLNDYSGTALDQVVAALPTTLNLSAWGDDHRGRLHFGDYEDLDFKITSITTTVPDTDGGTVPEPASLALAGLALLAAGTTGRRRLGAAEATA